MEADTPFYEIYMMHYLMDATHMYLIEEFAFSEYHRLKTTLN